MYIYIFFFFAQHMYVYIWPHSLCYVKDWLSSGQLNHCSIQHSFYWPCEQCILCLFTGRCLSLYLLTHFGTGSFWKSATVTGALTGAKLRLTIRSQTYRAPWWIAAKWLCFSLWGNSLLSLMLTVVVGYWGLARLLGLGGKSSIAGNGLRLRAESRMCSGRGMRNRRSHHCCYCISVACIIKDLLT